MADPSAGKEVDLSYEDLTLKQRLQLYVERIQDPDLVIQQLALESMRQEIRTATSLKFVLPHFSTLKCFFQTMTASENKKHLADMLSVMAMTFSDEGDRESLKYRLLGSASDIGYWGNAYIQNLNGEILKEIAAYEHDSIPDDVLELVEQIVTFHMQHNAEKKGVDLLLEVHRIDMLVEHVDSLNYKRACTYLSCFRSFLQPNNTEVLIALYTIYNKFQDFTQALRVALAMDESEYVKQIFRSTEDLSLKKQLSFIVARHGLRLLVDHSMARHDNEREELQGIINNHKLYQGYLTCANDIGVDEYVSPEDIYEIGFSSPRSGTSVSDIDAWQNIAATFVSAFVNAGFGQSINIPSVSSSSWLSDCTPQGKLTAAASLGMLFLWQADSWLEKIDDYMNVRNKNLRAGTHLSLGISWCGCANSQDPGILFDRLRERENKEMFLRDVIIDIGAIMGLGIAHAGSNHQQLKVTLLNILEDPPATIEERVFAALALSLVYTGSCDRQIARSIAKTIRVSTKDPLTRLLHVALGIVFLGKKESIESIKEDIIKLENEARKICDVTLLSLAYAGSGDVLKIQELIGHCNEHLDDGNVYQGHAVLGIALAAMAENVGAQMAIRQLEHLLEYGEANIRRAVPLALGILCISNPKEVKVVDKLDQLSRDPDVSVSMGAIISLGMIGAGTNNTRIDSILGKILKSDLEDDFFFISLKLFGPELFGKIFCARFSRGLIRMGSGLLTLSPFHSEHFLLSRTALAGIVIVLHACLDMTNIIDVAHQHYVLYFLVLAMQPRMLVTVDEDLKLLSVPVRTGRATDDLSHPGRTITGGFQNYCNTPILLAEGDRAELENDRYIPLSPVLEGFVILRKNPAYLHD